LLADGSSPAPAPGGGCLPQPSAMTITNNVFEMYNYVYHATSNIMLSEVVKITNEVMAFGKISDNVFFVQADVVTVPYAVLSVAAKYFTVTDNILYASGGPDYEFTGFAFPYCPMSFSAPAPFTITVDYAFVTDNNLDCCAMTAITTSKLTVTGTGSVESMNKGSTYKVPIDLARCSFQVDWFFDFVVGVKTQLYIMAGTGNDILWIGFTSADIPEGSKILRAELYVTGATLPHKAKLFRHATMATGAVVGVSAFVSQTTDPETIILVPTGGEDPQYVKNNMTYTVQVIQSAAGGAGGVYGLTITYKL
jgi:hypothetical protein